MDNPDWKDGYEVTFEVERDESIRAFSFWTRDGLVSKSSVRSPERALLAAIDRPGDETLVLDANYGVVGTVLAREAPDRHVTMAETSARAADCCRTNATLNEATNAEVELVPWAPDAEYDCLAFAPKPYVPTDVNKERLARGLSQTTPGGRCYVAATEELSAYRSVLSTTCDEVKRLETGAGPVVSGLRASEFAPGEYVTEHEFRVSIGGYTNRFLTVPGLFSPEELDAGTATLLHHACISDGACVLDLACGYGALGTFVGARTDCELYATDDNVLATTMARRNYERNGVTPVAVETADCLDGVSDVTFDIVLTNPPTHAGNGVTMKMFQGVRDVLADDGEFWLVYNEIMDYDRTLRTSFDFVVDVVANTDTFEVAVARL